MNDLDKVPTLVWIALVGIAGAVAWIVKVVFTIDQRYVKKEEAGERYYSKAETAEKFVTVALLGQVSTNRDMRCAAHDNNLKTIRDEALTRSEAERKLLEVERKAVHDARTEMNSALLRHEQKPGHAVSLDHINKIETTLAVMTQVQSDQKEILKHHGEVLEEIRSNVSSSGRGTYTGEG